MPGLKIFSSDGERDGSTTTTKTATHKGSSVHRPYIGSQKILRSLTSPSSEASKLMTDGKKIKSCCNDGEGCW